MHIFKLQKDWLKPFTNRLLHLIRFRASTISSDISEPNILQLSLSTLSQANLSRCKLCKIIIISSKISSLLMRIEDLVTNSKFLAQTSWRLYSISIRWIQLNEAKQEFGLSMSPSMKWGTGPNLKQYGSLIAIALQIADIWLK